MTAPVPATNMFLLKCPSKDVVNSKRKKLHIIISLTCLIVVDSGPCATAVPLGGRTDVIGIEGYIPTK